MRELHDRVALPPVPSLLASVAAAVCAVTAATLASWFLLGQSRVPDVVMAYLLAVVVTAMRFGYIASLSATLLGVAAFDFFFTRPYFSLVIDDARSVVTCAIMLFVAVVISGLTQRVRRHARAIAEREQRTARLYAMSRELTVAVSEDEIFGTASRHLRDLFGGDVSVLLRDEHAQDGDLVAASGRAPAQEEMATVRWVLAHGEAAGPGTEATPPTGARIVPLATDSGVIGVLVVSPKDRAGFGSRAHRELLDAFATPIAHAVARARLAEKARDAERETQNERVRNALLSSVSHDLRTPLAVVKGAASALLESKEELPAVRRREYLETISAEANRLNRLVRNLLDMTSLEAGALRVRREWQSIEELVGVSLARLDDRLEGRPVDVRIPAELPLVACDGTLVEQVLLNLIENATRYTPADARLEIRARQDGENVEVEIADAGPGVPPGEEEKVFEKFHRASRASGGMGLGLTICRGIVTAHGGVIACRNREEGGASFRFTLPRGGEPPVVGEAAESVGTG